MSPDPPVPRGFVDLLHPGPEMTLNQYCMGHMGLEKNPPRQSENPNRQKPFSVTGSMHVCERSFLCMKIKKDKCRYNSDVLLRSGVVPSKSANLTLKKKPELEKITSLTDRPPQRFSFFSQFRLNVISVVVVVVKSDVKCVYSDKVSGERRILGCPCKVRFLVPSRILQRIANS
ncbi:hypothetical protein TNCV_3444151 [Trichonephila clavipes]|nr:hypothetical protein TNCV_3444151 [Trichonephila clavipes]